MFKTLSLISFVLFAFMAGVIFGAKKQKKNLQAYNTESISKPLSDLKLEAPKKISLNHPVLTKKSQTPKPLEMKNQKRTGYTVVLASFRSKDSAVKHAKNISKKGYKAFYFAKEISGKTWHRVGVGSFSLKSSAEALKKELSKNKFAKGSLISEIPHRNQ